MIKIIKSSKINVNLSNPKQISQSILNVSNLKIEEEGVLLIEVVDNKQSKLILTQLAG